MDITNFQILLAEIRIFELDSTKSWGQYFKFYHGIWPSPSTFEGQKQYYTGYNDTFYFDIANTNKYMTNTGAPLLPIERCIYGQYISSKVDTGVTLPPQPWMTTY